MKGIKSQQKHCTLKKFLIAHLWKGRAKRWRSLNSGKTNLPNTITICKSKDASGLTKCNTLLNATNSSIELRRMANVVRISEDKSLVYIKANGNDVLGIGNCKMIGFINCKILPQKLFVIGKLNYQWHIKCILQQSIS